MTPKSEAEKFRGSKYGHFSAGFINICNQLRQLGVSSEVKLPTLVTAGNQSSGKSSVVEAIAGIPLPRTSGTNTGWLCRIKLKKEYDTRGNKLPKVQPEEDFREITRKEDITACVAEAQAALLAPDGLEFTCNTVVLELEGAEMDLTIVDLPGIIQFHPKGEHYVDMIKYMVKKIIEQQHVIMVMTLTAMDDLENQAVSLLSSTVDPDGHRTIGVITKPDNIPDGDHEKWVTLANNQNARQTLSLGYYVVKNPGQAQLDEGITFEEARERELQFFANDPNWSAANASRLGTSKLRSALSDMLLKRIALELPSSRQHAQQKLQLHGKLNVEHAPVFSISFFGLPTSILHIASLKSSVPKEDARSELQRLLQKVADELDDQVHCRTLVGRRLFQKVKEMFNVCKVALQDSMPSFEVKTTTISTLGNADLHSSELPSSLTLEDVQALRDQHLGHELPTFSPYSALEELIEKYKERWKGSALECLGSVKEELSERMEDSVKLQFGQFPDMMTHVSVAMSALLESKAESCKNLLIGIVVTEQTNTFTMNEHYFEDS
eukprot:gene15105-21161_t